MVAISESEGLFRSEWYPSVPAIYQSLENKDEAWINYAQYRPREEKPSMKTSFIMKVPGQNLIVGAGVYD